MPEVLIVDDEELIGRWARRVLETNGYSCAVAIDGPRARELMALQGFDCVLLDVHLPGESGLELLAEIRARDPHRAVVMFTGESDTGAAMNALSAGASGYVVKPASERELLIAIKSAMQQREQALESRERISVLESAGAGDGAVVERMLRDLHEAEHQLRESQAEAAFRLARMVEFRDPDTGTHLNRMSAYCRIIARGAGLPPDRCEEIGLAAQLHDVGKVAIPDGVLLKHGPLSAAEFDVMKGHCRAGYELLAGSNAELMRLGATIALTHHERWDGQGYPDGLKGEEIPIEGRIAAVADVFDALTSDRVYHRAMPVADAAEIIYSSSGLHFDPRLIAVFRAHLPSILEVHDEQHVEDRRRPPGGGASIPTPVTAVAAPPDGRPPRPGRRDGVRDADACSELPEPGGAAAA
jgi:putative two-component system response regulator